jgi:hypothetical protein
MSALPQKRTCAAQLGMSALGQKRTLIGLAVPLTERINTRQELCRTPRIVKLMSVVGVPMTIARLEDYFGCPC